MRHITNTVCYYGSTIAIKRSTGSTFTCTYTISITMSFDGASINTDLSHTGNSTVICTTATNARIAFSINLTTINTNIIYCRIVGAIINSQTFTASNTRSARSFNFTIRNRNAY